MASKLRMRIEACEPYTPDDWFADVMSTLKCARAAGAESDVADMEVMIGQVLGDPQLVQPFLAWYDQRDGGGPSARSVQEVSE